MIMNTRLVQFEIDSLRIKVAFLEFWVGFAPLKILFTSPLKKGL